MQLTDISGSLWCGMHTLVFTFSTWAWLADRQPDRRYNGWTTPLVQPLASYTMYVQSLKNDMVKFSFSENYSFRRFCYPQFPLLADKDQVELSRACCAATAASCGRTHCYFISFGKLGIGPSRAHELECKLIELTDCPISRFPVAKLQRLLSLS